MPVTYNAPVDLSARPQPLAPALGPAGTSMSDPVYGSLILRVTGPNTLLYPAYASFHGPADGFVHNWNSDGTIFWVATGDGILAFRFDPEAMTAVPLTSTPLGFTGTFSFRKPKILYGGEGLTVFEYDFSNGQRTTVFDAAAAVPNAAAGAFMPSVSDDDSRICLAFAGAPGRYQYVAVLDRTTGKYDVLDAKNSLRFGIEAAHIDRSGQFVIIAKGEGDAGAPPLVVWDLTTGTTHAITDQAGGEAVAGFGELINESGFSGSFREPVDYSLRSLDPAGDSKPEYLIDPDRTPTPHLPVAFGHFSWNNAQSGTHVPIVGTHYRRTQDEAQPWRAWDNEIIAVATDGSSRVWRLGHHFSTVDGSNPWDEPRGSVSQDGRWYLFTSNWGGALGTDTTGRARQDVFILKLEPAATVDVTEPAPPPPPSTPPPPDTNPSPVPSASGGSSMLSYASPYCGPSGGSTWWACGAWPTAVPPRLGPAGSVVADPDTRNRVLRVTGPGSFGEDPNTVFKGFDGGWRELWNANSSRVLIESWNGGNVKHPLNWVNFDAANMKVSGGTPVPYQFTDVEWDRTNPDVLVGIAGGMAQTYNVASKAWTVVFNPDDSKWGARPWLSAWGGNTVCIAEGPQDTGYRLVCYDRGSKKTQVYNLHAQTVNGARFPVYYKGNQVSLPSSLTMHTLTLSPDGKWMSIDTHGSSPCSVGSLSNYANTSLVLDLVNNAGYEWSIACGGTHWAYGYNGVMLQSASPRWTSTGANGSCNSDSRGIGRRNTDRTIDSSYVSLAPCRFFNNATWDVGVHLSWTNNANDANANQYPVIIATANEGISNWFLWSEIAAMETRTAAYQARLWRFAQTWNDPAPQQCPFLDYASPSVSRDGKWVLFLSDWRGQTGKGACTNGRRTDMFIFELK